MGQLPSSLVRSPSQYSDHDEVPWLRSFVFYAAHEFQASTYLSVVQLVPFFYNLVKAEKARACLSLRRSGLSTTENVRRARLFNHLEKSCPKDAQIEMPAPLPSPLASHLFVRSKMPKRVADGRCFSEGENTATVIAFHSTVDKSQLQADSIVTSVDCFSRYTTESRSYHALLGLVMVLL